MSCYAVVYTDPSGFVQLTSYPTHDRVPSEIPEGHFVVSTDDLPHSWERSSWTLSPEGVVSVDLVKVKNEARRSIRSGRKQLLQALDVEWIRAMETGAPTADIIAKKQRLRDLPSAVDTCTTVEEVVAILDSLNVLVQ